jgi:hypothetical protein
MKIKLGEIVQAVPHLGILIKKDISFRASYRISELINEINKKLETFDKVKAQIFQKYSNEVSQENIEKEINGVLDETVNLEYEPIDIETLVFFEEGVPKEGAIPVENMMILSKFFKSKEGGKQDETV